MKVGMAGAGAVGCHYGVLLERAGCEVVYLVRGQHYQALKKHGLTHISHGKSISSLVEVSDDVRCLSDCDVIVFTCKTTGLAALCEQLKPIIKPSVVLMTLQNGVTAADVVQQCFPHQGVIAASAFVGVRIEKPGVVIHSAAGHLRLGEWWHDGLGDGRADCADCDEAIGFLLSCWQKSGVDVQRVDDIRQVLWLKMLWNCGFNAITALTRRYARDIAADAEMVGWVRDAMSETIKAAACVGVMLPADSVDQHVRLTLNAGAVKTSMWQDIEQCRVTEIAVMNAYVVDLAQKHALNPHAFEAPVNGILTSLIRLASLESSTELGATSEGESRNISVP